MLILVADERHRESRAVLNTGTTAGAEEWFLWGTADPNARDLDLILPRRVVTGCSAALNARALDLIRRVAVVGAKAGSCGDAGLDNDNGGEMSVLAFFVTGNEKPFDIETWHSASFFCDFSLCFFEALDDQQLLHIEGWGCLGRRESYSLVTCHQDLANSPS